MRRIRNENRLWLILCSCCLVMLAFYGISHGREKSHIHITEICIKNSVCAYDDNGNYGADYIELYNDSDHAINLGGFGLSDDKRDLYKFVFEDTIIAPMSTIIVWNSANTDNISQYRGDYIPQDVHGLSFGLMVGENLILTDAFGNTIEKIAIPSGIPEGKVYASTLEKISSYTVSDPSPYRVAETVTKESLPEDRGIKQPVFSVDGGWYAEPISVALSAPQGVIYYTLDGSEPDEDSLIYAAPIYITDRSSEENVYASIGNISLTNGYVPSLAVDKATVLKAIVVVDGKRSPLSSQTYFIGLDQYSGYDGIAIMEITIDPADLFDYYDGIYQIGNVYNRYINKFDTNLLDSSFHYNNANYAKEGRGWERLAKIEFLDAEHQKVFEQNIGIRIHGGWSTSYNQKSFNLYARPEYDGNDSFLYDFWGQSFNKIMLRTGGFRDCYVTKMRDGFNQSLVEDRNMGIQRFEPCNVFLNGEYWGLYNLQETIGASYVSAYYGVAEDNVLIMKNTETNTVPEDAVLYNDIVHFAANNDLSLEENYGFIEDRIDIQSYIDYFCFQIYIGNCDSVANNFARWRSLKIGDGEYEDGKWRWLLYDTDDSAGMQSWLSTAETDSFISGHWSRDPLGENGDALFSALMRNDEFKRRFVVTFMDMANYNFEYSRVKSALSELSDVYRAADIKSQERFRGAWSIYDYTDDIYSGEYTGEVFDHDVAVIDKYYKDRYDYITAYMKQDLGLAGELARVTLKTNMENVASLSMNTLQLSDFDGEWSGEYYTDYPITLKCVVQEEYEFVGWECEGELLSSDAELVLDMKAGGVTITALIVPKEKL